MNKTFSYQTQILEKHLDTFGHVNNAVYLQLLEEARWDFIQGRGFSLEDIQLKQIGPVVLEINIRYKRELKNREIITIESETTSGIGKIMTLQQRIINADQVICSTADLTVGLMDLKQRKLIEPTAEWLEAIGLSS